MNKTLIILSLAILTSCCPEITTNSTSDTIRIIKEIKKDTVFLQAKPAITITDPSATFITYPSIETIDTTLQAKNQLRKYSLKIRRTATPTKTIINDSIAKKLDINYGVEITPLKADTVIQEITTNRQKETIYRHRPWWEIPVAAATSIFTFILGIIIGKTIWKF